MSVLIVTGTGTGVGKTVATAALAACARGSVAVVKPAQTGLLDGEPGDLAEVTRLTGSTDVHELARYPAPLSPHRAALLSGRPALRLDEVAARVATLAQRADHVLVEGAGGVLVPFADADRWTLLDLARALDAPVVVVTAAALGTLNHTALTLRELARASVRVAGVLIGEWPADPGLAERCNVGDLAALVPGRRLAGALPSGIPQATDFPTAARRALAPDLGGEWSWEHFARTARMQHEAVAR